MRIGFLTCELGQHNGWSHYSFNLLLALQRAGADLRIVTTRTSPKIEDLSALPVLPSIVPADKGRLVRMAALAPTIRAALSDCHLIHSTIEPFAPLGAWVAGNRPLFVTAHGSYIHLPRVRRWPVGALYENAFERATLVCVSRYTQSVAQKLLPRAQTVVVNNGVDAERFRRLVPLNMPKRGPVIVTTGGVKMRKGTLELIRSVAVVRQQIPNIQCIVIGSLDAEPQYTQQVRAEIEGLNLGDHVRLLGFVDEQVLLGWYDAADVFVLPSMNVGWKFEGFGLVYLEASAAGLPVIGTTDCGAEDAIDPGETGLLVPQNQVEEKLPEAILEILSNPQRAGEMGRAGHVKADAQSWDWVAEQMLGLYENALNR